MKKIVYNGRDHCGVAACPIVEHDEMINAVTIYDPEKPGSGSFTMSKEEYNTLLKNAKPIE